MEKLLEGILCPAVHSVIAGEGTLRLLVGFAPAALGHKKEKIRL